MNKAKLVEILHLSVTKNGNSKYLLIFQSIYGTIDTVETAPNSSLAIISKNCLFKWVEYSTTLYRNKIVLDDIRPVYPDCYKGDECDKVIKAATHIDYSSKIKLKAGDDETKWMNVSVIQMQRIKEILEYCD